MIGLQLMYAEVRDTRLDNFHDFLETARYVMQNYL